MRRNSRLAGPFLAAVVCLVAVATPRTAHAFLVDPPAPSFAGIGSYAQGQFLTTDPVLDVDSANPHTWNKYGFVRGNPLRFVDPDGRIVFESEDAEKKYNEAKQYLQGSKTAGEVLRRLESIRGKNEPILALTNNGRNEFSKFENTIYWDPSAAIDVTGQGGEVDPLGGTVGTPARSFLHEAIHAVHYLRGRKEFWRRSRVPDEQFGDAEERETIQKGETPAARELQEPTRETSGGERVYTGCVTCRTPIKKETQ